MWIAYYAALPLISLSAAAVAFYTAPLFMALLSRPLTGEPVGTARWLGIALGFVGVLVVLRPGGDTFSPAALLPVLAAFLYALAAIITRAKCADERPLVLALGLNLGLLAAGLLVSGALVLIPPAAERGGRAPVPVRLLGGDGGGEWALMALLALLMVAFGTGVAMAYQVAPAALIGTFDYTYVVFAVVWSYVLFAERPDAVAVVGLALIAAAGVLVAGRPAPASSPRRRRDGHNEGSGMTDAMAAIARKLADGDTIILDGATGTELQKRGAPMDDGAWCAVATASHPELLRAIHEDYVRAGADIVTANTFASARHLLERAGIGERTAELQPTGGAARARGGDAGRRRGRARRSPSPGSLSTMRPVGKGTDQRDPDRRPRHHPLGRQPARGRRAAGRGRRRSPAARDDQRPRAWRHGAGGGLRHGPAGLGRAERPAGAPGR